MALPAHHQKLSCVVKAPLPAERGVGQIRATFPVILMVARVARPWQAGGASARRLPNPDQLLILQ
jgi:hypothetical protein